MLPARVAIDPRESLDSYLERIALVNDLTTKVLSACSRRTGTDRRSRRLSCWSGLAAMARRPNSGSHWAGGIGRRGIRPCCVTTEARHSTSTASTRSIGRATAPSFARGGSRSMGRNYAHSAYRTTESGSCRELPVSTVCPDHGVYLVAECSRCSRRFRTRHHGPLRPRLDEHQPCRNPLGFSAPCRHPS